MRLDKELKEKAHKEIEEKKELVNKDYHRLKFHIMPPVGLINDPNGFIHWKGEYHLFYQFHPFGTNHGLKFWGHVKSNDLVNWEEMDIVLAPSSWYDSHGCYSGSGIDNDGELTLIYTGNVKDENNNRETYQAIVTSKNGRDFKKSDNNPVMYNQPEGYTRHFRDPKVWKKDDNWYMVIGTQTIDLDGRVLLFQSKDIKKWKLIGEVTGSNINGLKDFGYMWECPDLFSLNNRDVLVVSPQGLDAKGILYNNIYQSGYFVGELDYSTGRLNHGEFTELDRGFEFYAPQTTLDDKGRRIMIAWMGLPEREDHPTVKYGWIHGLTIPRELKLVDDKIYQTPIEEMESLRKNNRSYNNKTIQKENISLPQLSGDVFEMMMDLEKIDSEIFQIDIRVSEDNKEYTSLKYYKSDKTFEFNRNNSGEGYGEIRKCILNNGLNTIQIFSDTSSIEIFINGGEEVFTGRIYPDKNSTGIKISSINGETKIKSIDFWDLN